MKMTIGVYIDKSDKKAGMQVKEINESKLTRRKSIREYKVSLEAL